MVKKLFLLSVLIGFGLMAPISEAGVNIGETAPDFTLTDTNGTSHSLSQYKGKFVVLEWFNYDCPFVHKHYDEGHMQALQKEYTAKDVVWLSINSSAQGKEGFYSPEETNVMAKEREASPTALLLDSDGKVGKLYGAKTTPHMYIISQQGVLIYQGAIDSKPSADTGDIATSVNYVKQGLDEAIAGKAVSEPSTKSYGCSVKY